MSTLQSRFELTRTAHKLAYGSKNKLTGIIDIWLKSQQHARSSDIQVL